MKKLQMLLAGAALLLAACNGGSKFSYESISDDPMGVRIYTLENGLKVYMSVNPDAPRIQTYIGVRAGSKNDPSTSTGLAHYFEHLMFKGTSKIGTKDYATEKPLLDTIESLFERYRQTTDSILRADIYHQIDSISNLASHYAISNEYDRLMTLIGSQGSNAWTSFDQTVYVENIPSNELENWAIIQAERFADPVIRIFHTELETVYEEKNRSLSYDQNRVVDSLFCALFPNHTYGTQTTLGTDHDLKNPSITNIKQFYKDYYVPNNMAICLAGDFNPDSAIVVIERQFGKLKRSDVPQYTSTPIAAGTEPIVKEVYGVEPDMVYIAYRLPGERINNDRMNDLIRFILYNGTAGLYDLNVNQRQQVTGAATFLEPLTDYSVLFVEGDPKHGQPLEEVRDILLAQIDSIKEGNFGDWILEAAINNTTLDRMKMLTSNEERADAMVQAFTNEQDWDTYTRSFERMKKITKQDVMTYAKQWLGDDYAIVYKRQDPTFHIAPFTKPTITPVELDPDSKSDFFKMIESNPVTPIEPLFTNYEEAITHSAINEMVPMLYVQNTQNDLFTLYYVFDQGTLNDRRLPIAFDYLDYLGTDSLTPEAVKEQLLTMACSFNVVPQAEKTFVIVSGLADYMQPALQLVEQLLTNPRPDDIAFRGVIADELKARSDNKHDYNLIASRLTNYGFYGPKSPTTYVLSNQELTSLTAEEAIDVIKQANNTKYAIWYYGPGTLDNVVAQIKQVRTFPTHLADAPTAASFEMKPTTGGNVFLINFPSKQTSLSMISRGVKYNPNLATPVRLYNNYFSTVAFQELREARGLAYSVYSIYGTPTKGDDYYGNRSFIGTQNDKIPDAVTHFKKILMDMPAATEEFAVTKLNVENAIRTTRVQPSDLLWSYYNLKRLGLKEGLDKQVFEQLPDFSFGSLKEFHNAYIKTANYDYCLVGNKAELDMNFVKSMGTVKQVTLEEIFGY